MTEKQTKILTTIGKVGGLLTSAAGYENLIPNDYKWVGLVITLLSSTIKDVAMFLSDLWSSKPGESGKTLAILAIASLSLMPLACSTPQINNTVTAEKITVSSVNTAMQVWADWVKEGNATQAQVDTVKAAYEVYYAAQQSASAALHLMVNNINTNGPTAADIQSAQNSVAQAGNAIVAVITTYTVKK